MTPPTETTLLRVSQVRSAGPNGNYWYAVELSRNLKQQTVREVIFWKTSIAIFRGADSMVRAVENRCAHRHLRLSESIVVGNQLTCVYHGWTYDGCGRCTDFGTDVAGRLKTHPNIRIRAYPVQEKYGFIWIFPGDPALAEHISPPAIPQFDCAKPWPVVPHVATVNAHFSLVVENACDFNHEFLHRKYQMFTNSRLKKCWRDHDTVHMEYDSYFGNNLLYRLCRPDADQLHEVKVWYRYPYQTSDSQGKYLHWNLMLPIDATTTRVYWIWLHNPVPIPLVRLNIPFAIRKPVLHLMNQFVLNPFLSQDWQILQEEQRAYACNAEKPIVEYNPIISQLQEVILEQWDRYRASEKARLQQTRAASRQPWLHLGASLTPEDL